MGDGESSGVEAGAQWGWKVQQLPRPIGKEIAGREGLKRVKARDACAGGCPKNMLEGEQVHWIEKWEKRQKDQTEGEVYICAFPAPMHYPTLWGFVLWVRFVGGTLETWPTLVHGEAD